VSDGYTSGQILSAVKEVLTDRRVSQQQIKPLQAFEFIPGILIFQNNYTCLSKLKLTKHKTRFG